MEKTTFKHMVQPWARKWQSPFLIIFMNKVETEILSQSELKPLVLKRFIAFYRRHILALNYKQRQNRTCEQSSFTAEISDKETTFLDTYTSTKVQDSKETQSLICGLILNQLRHFNIHILNPAPQGNKKGFIKG